MSDETCGAICPEHGEPCSTCDTPEGMEGFAEMFGSHATTLEEHRESGKLHICIPDGSEEPHFWNSKEASA